jgi:hypothetical protein
MGSTVRSSMSPIFITSRLTIESIQRPFQWVMGFIPLGLKRLWRAAHHSLPPSVEVKNLRTSTTPVRLHGVIRGKICNHFTTATFPRFSTGSTESRADDINGCIATDEGSCTAVLSYTSSGTARRRADDIYCCIATDEGPWTAVLSSAITRLRNTDAQNKHLCGQKPFKNGDESLHTSVCD